MSSIWTLTLNPAIDMESLVEKLEPEVKLRSSSPRFQAGGGGVNVARVLTRLGEGVTAIFPCAGPLGRYFKELLKEESVDCETITLKGAPRINPNIRVKQDNKQYRFCMPGPEMKADDIQRILDRVGNVLQKRDILICSGSLPPGVEASFNNRLAKKVNEAGGQLILDTPGDILREGGSIPAYWLKPNLRELEIAVGHEVDLEAIDEELSAFRQQIGAEHILLTLGADGAVYCGDEGSFQVPSPDVEKVSSVGAGDSALAGLAIALVKGQSTAEAVRWAATAGAAAVMTPGTNLLEKDDFERLLKRGQET